MPHLGCEFDIRFLAFLSCTGPLPAHMRGNFILCPEALGSAARKVSTEALALMLRPERGRIDASHAHRIRHAQSLGYHN